MDFTEQDKKVLSHLGRTEDGRDLLHILRRAKNHYSSIATIDSKGDYGAQVEGRRIFISFVDDLMSRLEVKNVPHRKKDVDDYD